MGVRGALSRIECTTAGVAGVVLGRGRRRLGGLVLAGFVMLAGVLASVPGIAVGLPPGRHYEMVSPIAKGGYGATLAPLRSAVSPDGQSVAFFSPGVFAGAPSAPNPFHTGYVAHRGVAEWVTTPLTVPASLSDYHQEDLSPDLSLELTVGAPSSHEYELRENIDIWLRSTSLPDTLESWQGPPRIVSAPGREIALVYVGGSADLCHAFMIPNHSEFNTVEPLSEAEGTKEQVYDVSRGCHGEPAGIALVGVNNEDPGKLINLQLDKECHVGLGNEAITYAPQSSAYNAVNADGSDVYFSDCTRSGSEEVHQLFVRLGESRTVEVSRPLEAGPFGGCVGEGAGHPAGEVPCEGASTRASADFVGASEDGSRVYFTATLESGQTPLVPGDMDASRNLYVATVGCPAANRGCVASEREVMSLGEVSHDPNNGAPAEVQGVLRVAPDGERVYFVATGDLLSAQQQQALEAHGRPVPQVGAENLYVYEPDPERAGQFETVFITDLCTGTERSGAAEDFRCPGAGSDELLWASSSGQSSGESQTGGPGAGFLVFSTYAQLSSEDTNTARDVYRYDALTGGLLHISHGENGYDPNGSEGVLGAQIAQGRREGTLLEQHSLDRRAVSEDGSRIVFTSAEPLSPLDTNGLVNVYEWHDGAVSLVSTGSDPEDVVDVVISGDGSSVAFDTTQSLVPQDTDVLSDVYVARLGEDFPSRPAEREPCEGDGCQGSLTSPAPLLVPGSVSQAPGQDIAVAPAPVVKPAPKSKPKPKCRRRGQVRNGYGKCVKRGHRARGSSVAGRAGGKRS